MGESSSTKSSGAAGGGAIYALGIFGAWVYFWQHADTFWGYVPGCYPPRATWSADGRDLQLDSAGKIECPE